MPNENRTPLDPRLAYELAQRLTTISECPRFDNAIEALADDLRELCRDRTEAEWLVHEARHNWDAWKGTAGLVELLNAKRRTAPERQVFEGFGPRPVVDCETCQDFGTVWTGLKHEWCQCRSAAILKASNPTMVDSFNQRKIGNILKNT